MASLLHSARRAAAAAGDSSAENDRLRDVLGALDRYEVHVPLLLETWFDARQFRHSRELLCEVRDHAVAVPRLTVPVLELFIAHCEIVSLLWQESAQQASLAFQVSRALDRHAEACGVLRDVSSTPVALIIPDP